MSPAALVGALLLLAALSTSHRLQRVRSSLWAVHLTSTGYLFVLVGYLLGLTRADLSQPSLPESLLPAISMVSGWIGFSVGMAFHARVLRPLPRRAFALALAPGLVALIGVGLASFGLLLAWGEPLGAAGTGASLLAAAAATSAPTLAAGLRRRSRLGRTPLASTLRMMEFSAGLDVALALIAGALAFAFLAHGAGGLHALEWLGLTLGAGGLVGALTWLFLGAPLSDDERLLLGVGMIAFGSGIAGWLQLSPAVVGAVAGGVLVNLPGDRMTLLLRVLGKVERPALVILLATVGYAIAGVGGWLMLALIPLLSVGRIAAKILTTRRLAGEIPGFAGLRTEPGWGAGLISQGHLGLVLLLSLVVIRPQPLAWLLLASVGIAGLLSEIAAPLWVQRYFDGLARRGAAGRRRPGVPPTQPPEGAPFGGLTGEFRRALGPEPGGRRRPPSSPLPDSVAPPPIRPTAPPGPPEPEGEP